MKITLVGITVLLLLWSLYGYFASRVEQAKYTVIQKKKGYEVRKYDAHIVAETTVSGSYTESINKGFSIVAGYIFGNNKKSESISMTSPVTAQDVVSEKVPMTAPVVVGGREDARVISFVMPSSYTMGTLPVPNDSRVKLAQVKEKKFAAMRFAGYRTSDRIVEKQNVLLKALMRDGVEIVGLPLYAGYNAPFTPPWMTRNEVLVEIR